jgi:hypothetical protein
VAVIATSGAVGPVEGASPVFTDEIAFASDPFDSPQVYTDVTADTETRSIRRGRQTADERPSTGTTTLTLLDDSRRYDRDNASSPYAPNVIPMRRVRVTATLGATSYPVGLAFIDPEQGWQRSDDQPGFSLVTVPANDGFDVLATAAFDASVTFPEQLTGDRITAILDLIGWPTAERDVDTGNSQVQAVAAGDAQTDALSLILDAADTELGFFFIDAQGFACFHDRHRRLLPPYTVSQATFADGPNLTDGRLPYARLLTSGSRILNDIRITPDGLATQVAQDATSIGRFRQRTDQRSSTHASASDAASATNFRLGQTKDPYTRFDQLELTPGDDADIWDQVLAREIGDRITVIRTPPGGGDPDVKDVHIEAISLDIGPAAAARCVWRLVPADQTVYWLAGVAGFGEAGIATRGVY